MALKVYQKRGKLNYKERRMIMEIEEAIAKKYGNDPSISEKFIPAKDYEQLKELHTRYCIEDTPFEEVSSSDSQSKADDSNAASREILFKTEVIYGTHKERKDGRNE